MSFWVRVAIKQVNILNFSLLSLCAEILSLTISNRCNKIFRFLIWSSFIISLCFYKVTTFFLAYKVSQLCF